MQIVDEGVKDGGVGNNIDLDLGNNINSTGFDGS